MVSVVAELVAQVDAALDALADLDRECLSTAEVAELVMETHRLRSRAEAASTMAVGVFERRGDPESALSTASWVAHRCRVPKPQAKREVTNARELRAMPAVADAFSSGAIGEPHVSLLARARRFARDAFDKAEQELLDAARTLRFDLFRREVIYFQQLADPDQAELDAQEKLDRRRAHMSQTFEDTWQLDALFDPVSGAIFSEELSRLEKELFRADWADAREREANGQVDAFRTMRTLQQRRLDALTLMAQRSATLGNVSLARPLISVLVGYETYAGPISQLLNGTVLTPGQVASMFTDVDIERVVFDGPSRVTDLGRRSRTFVGGARRVVIIRDQECTDDLCDVPADRCDVDHIVRWEHGGETNPDNGRLRCPNHNEGRRKRRRGPPPDD